MNIGQGRLKSDADLKGCLLPVPQMHFTRKWVSKRVFHDSCVLHYLHAEKIKSVSFLTSEKVAVERRHARK
jgi:hypothetical protein